jgi:hypothetical protein
VIADVDGFNLAHATTPGTYEEVVDLLVPDLRRRGIYPDVPEQGLTARERIYCAGQAALRDGHAGSRYKYAVYQEEAPYVSEKDSRDLKLQNLKRWKF